MLFQNWRHLWLKFIRFWKTFPFHFQFFTDPFISQHHYCKIDFYLFSFRWEIANRDSFFNILNSKKFCLGVWSANGSWMYEYSIIVSDFTLIQIQLRQMIFKNFISQLRGPIVILTCLNVILIYELFRLHSKPILQLHVLCGFQCENDFTKNANRSVSLVN